ncbi:hypothetical protein SAMN04487914_1635 [Arthrobacter sp. ok909]|uniref:hypothetical protein n=1 Tax=Arthrobacter sp. ok909 TaxID=1761746 RepID=UPI0008812503|nr:hypothetical protein [Arthrobacter sp. ok909]SDP85084.1 hypothetical protein SAMN04487914_1635 [Arthrobacter sp. ok909]
MTPKQDTPAAAGPDAVASGPSGRMPLGARRLLMIGGLSVPAGLVAGPYLLGGQLLALAGLIMAAAALSYSIEGPWFSRWSWITTTAGVLWLAATAAYWGSIIAAAEASAQAPAFAPALFTTGLACFGVMAIATVVAMTRRAAKTRNPRAATT